MQPVFGQATATWLAFSELADVTKHVAAWVDNDFDASLVLGHFILGSAEERRLVECRRLFALMWPSVLAREDPEHLPILPILEFGKPSACHYLAVQAANT